MAIAGFKPALGALALGTAGFSLAGDNAGFCNAILSRGAAGSPARLESLTYVLPGPEQEAGGGGSQSPVVVNLLMQLRASCDQNNIFLRTGQASQAQIMAQLRQTLARSDRAVRAQAGEIERAVRNSLFQEHEFRQALARLEREVKKNGGRPGQPDRLTANSRTPAPPRLGRSGSAAFPPLSKGGVQARKVETGRGIAPLPGRPAGQTVFAQPRQAGQRAPAAGQAGPLDLPGRQTAAREEARQDGPIPSAAAGLGPSPPEQGVMPLTPLHPQGVERPAGAAPQRGQSEGRTGGDTRKEVLPKPQADAGRRQDAPSEGRTNAEHGQEIPSGQQTGRERLPEAPPKPQRDAGPRREASSERLGQGAEARKQADGPAGQRPEGPRAIHPAVKTAEEPGHGMLPAGGRIGTARPGAAVQDVPREGGGGPYPHEAALARRAVGPGYSAVSGYGYAVPSPWRPAGTARQAERPPMLRLGWFPVGLRLRLAWRTAGALPASFAWSFAPGWISGAAGMPVSLDAPALKWRQAVPALGDGGLPGAGPGWKGNAPRPSAWRGAVRAGGGLSAVVPPLGETAGRVLSGAVRGLTGHDLVRGLLSAGRVHGAYRAWTRPGADGAVRANPLWGLADRMAFPAALGLAAGFAGQAVPDGWAVRQTVDGRSRGRRGLADAPQPGTAANSSLPGGRGRAPAVRRTPGQWLAMGGVERYGAARWTPGGSPRAGTGGYGTRPGTQGRPAAQGRGPAGWRAVQSVRHIWARPGEIVAQDVPPQAGETVFRVQDVPTQATGGIHPAKNAPSQAGEPVLQARGALLQPAGTMLQVQDMPSQIVKTVLQAQNVPSRRGGLALRAGNAPVQPAGAAFQMRDALSQTGKTALCLGAVPAQLVGTVLQTRTVLPQSVGMALHPHTVLSQSVGMALHPRTVPSQSVGMALHPRTVPSQSVGRALHLRTALLRPVEMALQTQNVLFQPAGAVFRPQAVPPQTRGRPPQSPAALFRTAQSQPGGWNIPPAGRTAPWARAALSRSAGRTPQPPAGQAPDQGERRPPLPGLAYFAQPLGPIEGTLPGTGPGPDEGSSPGTAPGPAMVFRSPAPAAARTAPPQEQEGEAVLSAQTVAPEQARAMNRVFSYAAPAGVGRGSPAESEALLEQRAQTVGSGLQEVNYNRLTEEILVRIERRLRSERRKFGL